MQMTLDTVSKRGGRTKSGNMEIGARVQAGIKVSVKTAPQEQWQNQSRKYENALENACENRGNAKQSFQSGPFSAQSAKHIIFCTAQGGNASPENGGFEASLGMDTSSYVGYWQKSLFENMLPTEGEEHIFIKFAKHCREIMSRSIKNG